MRIIAGAFKGRTLKTASGPGYRPAMSRVRESLFSLLESRGVVWSAQRVLDLFAGSGSLAFEALSRGARQALLVEKDAKAAEYIRKNAHTLGVEDRCRVLVDDVVKAMSRPAPEPYGVIFIDPPYALDLFPKTTSALLKRGWLAEDGFLVAEVEKHFHLKPDFAQSHGLELDTDRTYGQTRILIYTPRQEEEEYPA